MKLILYSTHISVIRGGNRALAVQPKDIRISIICPVYNEEILLPQFLAYYGPEADAIMILDNQSTDGTRAIAARHPRVHVSTIRSSGKFDSWALHEARQKALLACRRKYDYSLVLDCDEWLVPKGGGHIRDRLMSLWPSRVVGTEGYQMWKHPNEAPYDPRLPLLSQRSWGIQDLFYSKPVILRPESHYALCVGNHDLVGRNTWTLKDPSHCPFYLLHFRGFDEGVYVERSMARALRLSEANRTSREKWGLQYHKADIKLFRARFHEGSRSKNAVRLPV